MRERGLHHVYGTVIVLEVDSLGMTYFENADFIAAVEAWTVGIKAAFDNKLEDAPTLACLYLGSVAGLMGFGSLEGQLNGMAAGLGPPLKLNSEGHQAVDKRLRSWVDSAGQSEEARVQRLLLIRNVLAGLAVLFGRKASVSFRARTGEPRRARPAPPRDCEACFKPVDTTQTVPGEVVRRNTSQGYVPGRLSERLHEKWPALVETFAARDQWYFCPACYDDMTDLQGFSPRVEEPKRAFDREEDHVGPITRL